MKPGRWPAGGGEMARRIREHDWSRTPLGPSEAWPQSLKTAAEMVLGMPGPATILWGPQHVQLYNDAYIAVARDRHPGLLGRPAEEGWPDAYEGTIAPLLDTVRLGRPTELADYPVALRAPGGRLEERVFDTAFSPVRDESGGVAGALQTLVEVTGRKRAEEALREGEERQAFLLELGDALRAEPDADSAASRALSLLFRHLGLDRTYVARIRGAENPVEIVAERGRDDLAPMPAQLRPADFPRGFQKAAEGVLVVDDVRERSDLTELDRLSLEAIALTAFIVAPLHRGADGMIWALVGGSKSPRTWKPDETALMQEAAERTWAAMERARAEEALRENEERYRTLVENVGDHAVYMLDADGIVTEWTESARRVKGYAAEEVVGRHFSLFHAPEGIAAGEPDRELAEAAREGRAEREGWRVRKDGERVWVDEIATALRGAGGEPVGFVKIARDLTERRELEEERGRARARELTALAEAAERERISRELHDRVAHHMGVAHQSLELFAALRAGAPERAEERLGLARESARLALDQTRALSAELKRLQEEELEDGLEAAFRALAEGYVPDGVAVDVSVSGDEAKIPNPIALQAYLAMREAVRNAVRHSGCSRIGISLGVEDGEVAGSVEDDGRGFDPAAVGKATPSWGVGLRSMRERAEMLGGEARVDSRPGNGTRVEVRVPLDGRGNSAR